LGFAIKSCNPNDRKTFNIPIKENAMTETPTNETKTILVLKTKKITGPAPCLIVDAPKGGQFITNIDGPEATVNEKSKGADLEPKTKRLAYELCLAKYGF